MTLDHNNFQKKVNENFALMQKHTLLEVEIDRTSIFDLYLSSFKPEHNKMYVNRTEYDCNLCRHFVKIAGPVVAIVDDKLVSIWDFDYGEFNYITTKLSELIHSKPIKNKFYHYENKIGTKQNFNLTTGEKFTHLHVDKLNSDFISSSKDIPSLLSSHSSDKQVFSRSLEELTLDSLDVVLELIEQNTLYRGQEFKKMISAFRDLKITYSSLSSFREKEIFVWKHVSKQVNSPVLNIRNTVIGTLLTDLSESKDLEAAVTSYEKKVAGDSYKRSKSLITPRMKEEAKKDLEASGYLSSLERRFACLSDISIDNVLYADKSAKKRIQGDIFDSISTTASSKKLDTSKLEEVSIDTFIEKILPTAKSIQVMMTSQLSENLVSLITAQDSTSPSMFKWNNKFSWSYSGNVADSIKQRVKEAGGNVEGDFRASLRWYNSDDLDLHLEENTPNYYHVYHVNKGSKSPNGGYLDVDMNYMTISKNPVENIIYPTKSTMKRGTYNIYVKNYKCRESNNPGFELELELDGQIHSYHYDKPVIGNVQVVTVSYDGKSFSTRSAIHSSTTSKSEKLWNIDTNEFHKVSSIMYSPNYWNENGVGNKHVFFMLDNCINDSNPRGFYNEFLSSDLEKHRKFMEVLGSVVKVPEAEDQLSGLGFSLTKRASIVCKIEGAHSRMIKITF